MSSFHARKPGKAAGKTCWARNDVEVRSNQAGTEVDVQQLAGRYMHSPPCCSQLQGQNRISCVYLDGIVKVNQSRL